MRDDDLDPNIRLGDKLVLIAFVGLLLLSSFGWVLLKLFR